MEIKLSPNMFSLSQYYKILIEDMTILRYFVNSAMYTAAILLGAGAAHSGDGLRALPFQISRAGRAVLRRDHADASAVSGDDGAQRHHAARDGAAGHDLGDHSADDGRAVLHLSAAAVHGWPAGRDDRGGADRRRGHVPLLSSTWFCPSASRFSARRWRSRLRIAGIWSSSR